MSWKIRPKKKKQIFLKLFKIYHNENGICDYLNILIQF